MKLYISASGAYSGDTLYYEDLDGYYWSATFKPRYTSYAYDIFFSSEITNPVDYIYHEIGFPIRAININ